MRRSIPLKFGSGLRKEHEENEEPTLVLSTSAEFCRSEAAPTGSDFMLNVLLRR